VTANTQEADRAVTGAEPPSQRVQVATAARVLSRLGLVTAFGHVSARTGEGFLITPAADLGIVDEASLVTVPAGAEALPAGAPAEAWLHLALYRARPDVAAIARAQPPAAFAAAAAGKTLHPLYGQAAWLGPEVPVHDDARLLRGPDLAQAAARALPAGEALLLRGNGAVTTGDSPGLAVARMWLLGAACTAWLSTPPAERRGLSGDEIESWRAVSGELLPRLWHHLIRKATS
jgi:HCOMODA/2-hydroxy-3-carboxy-muconic semialdehyde decarboxylase